MARGAADYTRDDVAESDYVSDQSRVDSTLPTLGAQRELIAAVSYSRTELTQSACSRGTFFEMVSPLV